MIAITGATGQLGQHVIENLLKTVPARQIVAIVRNPAKAAALSLQGITVRRADYTDEAAFTTALQGIDKLLLISSSEVGQRTPQHRNVINAAKSARVKFIAYTSLLHADTSRWGWQMNTWQPRGCWQNPASISRCCVTAGTAKTISPAPPPPSSTACLLVPPETAKSPPPPARTTLLPPRVSSVKKAMPGKSTSWREIKAGR